MPELRVTHLLGRSLCAAVAALVLAGAAPAMGAVYVDAGSRGGPCSDGRSAAAASSPGTPWCSLARAVEAAPPGADVLVREGSYGQLAITGQHRSVPVTVRAHPGERVSVSDIYITSSSGWTVSGFQAGGSETSSVFTSSRITIAANDFSPRGLVIRAVKDTVVQGNAFHDIKRDPTGAAGAPDGYAIWANGYWNGSSLDGIDRLTIRGNVFRNVPNDGIQLGGGDGRVRDVTIEGNEFDNVRRVLEKDHSDSLQVLGGDGVFVRGNYFHDSETAMLFKDDVTRRLVVANNLVLGGRGGGIQVQLWDTPGALVVNNTIWESKLGGLRLAEEPEHSGTPTGIIVRNNILDGFTTADSSWISAQDHNLIMDGPRGPTDSTAAPTFGPGYELAPGSAGIDGGISDGAPATDRHGRPRVDHASAPNAAGVVDIGAHELVPDGAAGTPPAAAPPKGAKKRTCTQSKRRGHRRRGGKKRRAGGKRRVCKKRKAKRCRPAGNTRPNKRARAKKRRCRAPGATRLALVNAASDKVIARFAPLKDGAVLDLATVPDRLSIRARTGRKVKSVRFGLDGDAEFRIESSTPYALAGNTGRDYHAWTPTVGPHTVTATPYTRRDGRGKAGRRAKITFSVVDSR